MDGFTLGTYTEFTSVDDQAAQANAYVKANCAGHLDCVYGLSLGGKILSRMMERDEIDIDHAVMDAAPLLPLPLATLRIYFPCLGLLCAKPPFPHTDCPFSALLCAKSPFPHTKHHQKEKLCVKTDIFHTKYLFLYALCANTPYFHTKYDLCYEIILRTRKTLPKCISAAH